MQELALIAEDLELACRTDPELFFAEAPADVELAKALCTDCPIRRACSPRGSGREHGSGMSALPMSALPMSAVPVTAVPVSAVRSLTDQNFSHSARENKMLLNIELSRERI